MKEQLLKVILLLALVAYFYAPFLLSQHLVHMGHNHMAPMENCLFAFGEHALCPMDTSEHLSILQRFSISTVSFLKIYLMGISTLLFVLVLNLSLPFTRYLFYLRRGGLREYFLYQDLFSQGILNSKAP